MSITISPAAEAFRQAFRNAGRRFVDLPEVADAEGRPLRVWFTPLTLGERQQIDGDSSAKEADKVTKLVIMKAQDESGRKLFSADDRMVLQTEAFSAPLYRLFAEMHAPPTPPSDLAKN